MELTNKTPLAAARVVVPDQGGGDLLVAVVKGTYQGMKARALKLADEQRPVQLADEHHGEPDKSSIRWESDLAPYKPGTDLILVGHAWATRGKATEVPVSLRVAGVRRVVVVYGDRRWGRMGMGAPEPFEKMPLVYERAFGGCDLTHREPRHHEREDRNPVGRGFRARKSATEPTSVMLPNLEDPAQLIRSPDDRPSPAAFGFVGRHWTPRRALAGTMDAAWLETRSPLPPQDFDERYHNSASAGLVAPRHLAGGEPVEILGASPTGALVFSLPQQRPGVSVTIDGRHHDVPVALDTVVFLPDDDQVVVTWRGRRRLAGDLQRLTEVRVEGA